MSKVPDRGPYTTFMGNLHYETTEATDEKIFGGLILILWFIIILIIKIQYFDQIQTDQTSAD